SPDSWFLSRRRGKRNWNHEVGPSPCYECARNPGHDQGSLPISPRRYEAGLQVLRSGFRCNHQGACVRIDGLSAPSTPSKVRSLAIHVRVGSSVPDNVYEQRIPEVSLDLRHVKHAVGIVKGPSRYALLLCDLIHDKA